MIIEFADEDLRLFVETRNAQKTLYKRLRSNNTFMRDLLKVFTILRMVNNVDELAKYSALRYEKLKYDYSGCSSVRIGFTSKYRLIFSEHDGGIKILIIQISEHYGDK